MSDYMKMYISRLLIVALFVFLFLISITCVVNASADHHPLENARSKWVVDAQAAVFLYHNTTSIPTVVSGEYLDVWGVLVEDSGTYGKLDDEITDLRLANRTITIYWEDIQLGETRTGDDGTFAFSTRVNKDVGVYRLIAEFVPTPIEPESYITVRDYKNITVRQQVIISASLNTTTVTVGGNILMRNGEIRVNSTLGNYTLGIIPIYIRLDDGELLRTLNVTNGVFSSELTIPNWTTPYSHNITITMPETAYYVGTAYTLQTPITVRRKAVISITSKTVFRGETVVINGTLLDNMNAPVIFDTTSKPSGKEGIKIYFGGSERKLIDKSEIDGRFTYSYSVNLSDPVGNTSVVVSFTGTSTSPYYISTSSEMTLTIKAYTKLLLGEAGGFSDVLIRGRAVYVGGRLYDVGNPSEPLPGRDVFVNVGEGADQEGNTNIKGEFSVLCNIEKGQQLGSVNVTVRYKAEGEYFYVGNTSVVPFFIVSEAIIGLDPIEKIIKGDEVTIRGKIEDDNGEPISYGLINLYWMQDGKQQQLNRELDENGSKYLPISAGVDGAFVFKFGAYEIGGEIIDTGDTNITVEFVGVYVYAYNDSQTNNTIYTYNVLTDSNKTLVEKKNQTYEDKKSALYVPYIQSSKTVNYMVFANTIFEIYCPPEAIRVIGAASFSIDGTLLEYYGDKYKTNPITPVKSQIVKAFFGDIYRTNLTTQNGSFLISFLSIVSEGALGNTRFSIAYNGSDAEHLLPTTISGNITIKSKTKLTLVGLPVEIIKDEEFNGTVLLRDDKSNPLDNRTIIISIGENDTTTGITDNNGNFNFKKRFTRYPLQDEKITIQVSFDEGNASLNVPTNASVAISYKVRPPSETLNIVYYLIGAGIGVPVILILFYVSHWRRKHQLQEMQRIIKRITKQLIAGNEYIATIFKAYRRFEILLKRQGHLRQEWETFREFEKALKQALPISGKELGNLLTILEEARYSKHEIGENQRDITIQCLQHIETDISKYLQSDEYRKKIMAEEKAKLEAKKRERMKIFKRAAKADKKPKVEEIEVEDLEILIDKRRR